MGTRRHDGEHRFPHATPRIATRPQRDTTNLFHDLSVLTSLEDHPQVGASVAEVREECCDGRYGEPEARSVAQGQEPAANEPPDGLNERSARSVVRWRRRRNALRWDALATTQHVHNLGVGRLQCVHESLAPNRHVRVGALQQLQQTVWRK